MSAAADEAAGVRRAAAGAAAAASRHGSARLFVARTASPDPGDVLDRFAAGAGASRFVLERPAHGVAVVGLGEAVAIEAAGPARLDTAARRAESLFEDAHVDGAPAEPAAGPLLVGGFAFADVPEPDPRWEGFPPLRFVLPELLLVRRGGRTWRCVAGVVAPGEAGDVAAERVLARLAALDRPATPADPAEDRATRYAAVADRAPGAYRAAVARALARIADGELEKVVLARAATLARPGGFDAARVLRTLRAAHPACFVYGVGRGDAVFVGASPERLIRRDGERLRADALAGSAPRGRTPEEDERLGRALRESKKEQAEHAIVRRAVVDALRERCAEVAAPESPSLLRLDGIQHLHTPVSARLAPGDRSSVLALAARLHPTPAVGGAPRGAALAFLRAHEDARRGWYAGGVGWVAAGGDGELAVALRSALLRGDEATLHAGAGVVAGSTPEGELAETRLKLRAALAALLEI